MFYLYDFVSEYVMFPPQSPSGSSNMSTWSEDGLDTDGDGVSTISSLDKNGEDETVQIITEVSETCFTYMILCPSMSCSRPNPHRGLFYVYLV